MPGRRPRRDITTHPRAGLSATEFDRTVRACAESEQISIKQARRRVLEVLRSEDVGSDPLPETRRIFEEVKEKGKIGGWESGGRFTATADTLLPLDLNSSR